MSILLSRADGRSDLEPFSTYHQLSGAPTIKSCNIINSGITSHCDSFTAPFALNSSPTAIGPELSVACSARTNFSGGCTSKRSNVPISDIVEMGLIRSQDLLLERSA